MRFLSNKEKKELEQELPKGLELSKKEQIKEKGGVYYKTEKAFLIERNKILLPHLHSIPTENYPSVTVDLGAIPFIAKGADLMRPGIQKVEGDFEKEAVVMVKDEKKGKVFALGLALLSSEEMTKQEKGKSLEIYHWLGDQYC
jgi:PUA domain protein